MFNAAIEPHCPDSPSATDARNYDADKRRARRQEENASGRIEDVPEYRQLLLQRRIVDSMGFRNPYFRRIEKAGGGVATIGDRTYANFSTYDYLDLNSSPEVAEAVVSAVGRYGCSAGGSRAVSGERAPTRELEEALANFLGYPDCLAFVSGYLANASLLPHLFGKNDLIALDALSHNSLIAGAVHSGAGRFFFPHNDMNALDRFLTESRDRFDRALIAAEGLYGMDGTIGDLPGLLKLKKRHRCFLMLDEAHSLGVLGAEGRGATEHFGVDPSEIDINMGTLSKVLCGCGGYVCGSAELIHYLRYTAPGFLYSVGLSPLLAAASRAALGILKREPGRVARLRNLSRRFLERARTAGLDVGQAAGEGVVPVFVGNSMAAALTADRLFSEGINVLPMIHPVVPEGAARIRFFFSSAHQEEQLDEAVTALCGAIDGARGEAERLVEEGRWDFGT